MKNKKIGEIVSLSEALLTFDSGSLSLEALEQRLEMVIIKPCCLCNAFDCTSFGGCDCPTNTCPANCAVFAVGTS